jgi:hypothetical protein
MHFRSWKAVLGILEAKRELWSRSEVRSRSAIDREVAGQQLHTMGILMNIEGLTSELRKRVPFTFVKFGDGELFCMSGRCGQNCDHHPYSRELGDALISAFQYVVHHPQVYIGRWHQRELLAPFERRCGVTPRYVSYGLLLLTTLAPKLLEFYTALAEDRRRKVLVGPARLSGAQQMLRCSSLVEVPLVNAFGKYREIRRVLEEESSGEIFLFCAGMTSKVWISDLLRKRKTITCLDLGSALDPLFVGQTRSHQLSQKEARQFFKPLLPTSTCPAGG